MRASDIVEELIWQLEQYSIPRYLVIPLFILFLLFGASWHHPVVRFFLYLVVFPLIAAAGVYIAIHARDTLPFRIGLGIAVVAGFIAYRLYSDRWREFKRGYNRDDSEVARRYRKIEGLDKDPDLD